MIPQWPDCMQRKSAPIWGIHVLNLKSLADQSINNNSRADNERSEFSFLTREHQRAIITITADKGLRSARIVACTIVMSPSDLPFSRTRKLFPIESCSLQSVLDFEIVWLDKIQTLTYQRYFAVDSAVGRVRSGVARNYALCHKFSRKSEACTHLAIRVIDPSAFFFKTNGNRFDTTIKLLLAGVSAAVIVISHLRFLSLDIFATSVSLQLSFNSKRF